METFVSIVAALGTVSAIIHAIWALILSFEQESVPAPMVLSALVSSALAAGGLAVLA